MAFLLPQTNASNLYSGGEFIGVVLFVSSKDICQNCGNHR